MSLFLGSLASNLFPISPVSARPPRPFLLTGVLGLPVSFDGPSPRKCGRDVLPVLESSTFNPTVIPRTTVLPVSITEPRGSAPPDLERGGRVDETGVRTLGVVSDPNSPL